MKRIIYIALLFLLTGCGKFLDDYSQDLVVAKTVTDLDEILLGSAYLPTKEVVDLKKGGLAWWLHILDDDINPVTEQSAQLSFDMDREFYGYTTWQLEVGRSFNQVSLKDDNGVWDELYQRINAVNIILSEIDNMKQDTEKTRLAALRIKGEAHFLRAQFYLTLVNLYADMYTPEKASTTLGVPLKLTHYVEHDKSKDAQFVRATVGEVYGQIVKDLKSSLDYFKQSPQIRPRYRASKEASLLLLSRVYLYMQDWANAKSTAAELLAVNNVLMNYGTMTANAIVISDENPEIIFSQSALNLQNAFTARGGDFCITDDLYRTYDVADFRKDLFFTKAFGTDSIALHHKYKRGTHKSAFSDLFMLRTSEAYLNMAEACAMMDEAGEASKWLNKFRSYRIDAYQDVTFDAPTAITEVRAERRKELCLEGHRWFDLRRYASCTKAPFKRIIEHRFALYNWDIRNLLLGTEVYKLNEGDHAYTFAIPKLVLEFDRGMPNNPREARKPSQIIDIKKD